MGLFNRGGRTGHELLDSVIGPGANLSGTFRSDGGLRVDGHFEGLIEVAGNVLVVEGAQVAADITARNITVGGSVKGNINGAGRLEILATGEVIGDITVASVMIDDGGVFQGISRMRGYEQRALAAPAPAPANGNTPPVYVEEPRPEPVTTVDLTAREAREAPAAAVTPAAEVPAGKASVPEAPAAAEIDFDDIEPVIPDIVIEEPPPAARPATRRSGRR